MSDADTPSSWIDPDDAPELTDKWFGKATFCIGDAITHRGRPPGSAKTQVSLRLNNEVIAFKADGPGWQSPMNTALRKTAWYSKLSLRSRELKLYCKSR